MLLTEEDVETVIHQFLFHLGLISCNTFTSNFFPLYENQSPAL